MGKTISITIPDTLEKELQNLADTLGASRSRVIGNILLRWQEKRMKERQETKECIQKDDQIPNDCLKRDETGFCNEFEHICNAPQHEADTCIGYPPK